MRGSIFQLTTIKQAKTLFSKGAGVNGRDKWGRTPLHTLCTDDHALAAFLVEAGADVDARDDLGRTPLFYLASVRVLVEAGADVNARDERGRTPLHAPIGEDRAIDLIQLGADIHAQDLDGMTPAQTASTGVAELIEQVAKSRRVQTDVLDAFNDEMSKLDASAIKPSRRTTSL